MIKQKQGKDNDVEYLVILIKKYLYELILKIPPLEHPPFELRHGGIFLLKL